MKFKNTKTFVEHYNLDEYITNAKAKWKHNTYGKDVEKYVVQASKLVDEFKMTKTTPEYDYIYGADFKILFNGGGSCYCDLKICNKLDRLKDVDTFLGSDFKFDASYDEMHTVEVGNGTFMCLGIKHKRTLYQGTIVYEKPVLVPMIYGNIRKEDIINEEVANNIRLLLALGDYDLTTRCGYDKTAKRAFTFIPKETI